MAVVAVCYFFVESREGVTRFRVVEILYIPMDQ